MKAVIDLGTNTFQLLIAEIADDKIYEHYELQIPVKLGKGGINNNYINDEAFVRGIAALSEFKKQITLYAVSEIKLLATSAIRNATNGKKFADEIARQFGFSITTILGSAEAEYIYKGVFHSFQFPDTPVLVLDIGGGSVETIIGIKEKILWKQSFEIGAARLLEKFHLSDPISTYEIEQLNLYLEEKLIPLFDAIKVFQPIVLIGSAGSFETLVDVVIKDFAVIPKKYSNQASEISIDDFEAFVELMKTSTIAQRSCLKGMTDFRVDMITVSALLMQYIVHRSSISQIICSNYSLKEGVLFT